VEAMMTTRWRPNFDPNYLYFVTTKAVGYRHVFRRDIIKRIIVDTMHTATILKQSTLYAFVIMPNHIHALLQCNSQNPPGDWVRILKTVSARLIIRLYRVEKNYAALEWLTSQVKRSDRQSHKVWEDNYLAKAVVTESFMLQKLKYIHNNPMQSHWTLSATPIAYPWSSAAYYEGGACLIPVKSVFDLLEQCGPPE
jgi:putative transposase